MNFRLCLVISVFCVVLSIHHETEAKAILDFFFDTSKFQNNYYNNYHHRQPVEAPRPVGGKERFKQICNVIHGIGDCYA